MISRNHALGALAALLLAACATPYRVQLLEPGLSGLRITRMHGNYLPAGPATAPVEFDLERIQRLHTPSEFAVVIQTAGDLAVPASEPLVVLGDGDSLTLTRNQGRDLPEAVAVRHEGIRIEEARYPIPAPDLLRLGSARAVRVRLRRGPFTEERHLSARNLQRVRDFVALYVARDTTVSTDTTTRR